MPELPEVETVRRSLEEILPGEIITKVHLFYPPLISSLKPEIFLERVSNQEIQGVGRRGKYLLLQLDDVSMAIHLRMTGSLLFLKKRDVVKKKHTHLILSLGGGDLHYIDPRKFGRILLLEKGEDIAHIKRLGPEPLSSSFVLSSFRERIQGRRKRIKSLLLDQGFLAGLGNIYSDEALYLAKIHPAREAHTLTHKEEERLFYAIREILEEAIAKKGTTLSDYSDATGERGSYQRHLKVYSLQGEKCHHCQERFTRVRIGGRSSSFCPTCQR